MENFSVEDYVQDYIDNINQVFENYYNDNLSYEDNLNNFLPFVNQKISECRRQILNFKRWAITYSKLYGADEDEVLNTQLQIQINEMQLDYLLKLRIEIFRECNIYGEVGV
jgi:hypothetical protein